MKLVSAVPKRADAQREMRRQNGQRETKFIVSSGRDDFSLSESFCKTAATALMTWSSPRWPGLLQFRVFDHARTCTLILILQIIPPTHI
jgi:hypothetical protein